MKRRKLDESEIRAALAALAGWAYEGGELRRELRFASFADAFGFMTAMALVSEAMNHHPEWRNGYDRVAIAMSTHDAGGVTELDLEWVRRAERTAARFELR